MHTTIVSGGYAFIFKFDSIAPEMLHIWARHLKTSDDAIRVFFNGAPDIWNQEFERFETSTETETLYWVWKQKDETVYVISCFDKG
jgi:hypothetical protein